MGFSMRSESGLSRKNWRQIWKMLVKQAPARQQIRQACVFEGLEPRTLMSAVTGQALSPTSVQLNWTDSSSESGYYVMRSTNNGASFSEIAKLTSGSVRTYTDTTVQSNHTYDYEIEGYTTKATAAPSNMVAVTTPMVTPTGMTATATAPNSVKLSWTNKDSTTVGYYILRSTAGGAYTQIAQITSAGTTTYTDTTAKSGTTYSYQVEEYAANGATSTASNTASATTTLFAPSAAKATALSTTSVQITWTDNDANATGYYVLRATDSVHFSIIGTISSATAASYTDNSVASAHTYQYEVEATKGAILSAASAMASVTTPLAHPTSMAATTVNPNSVVLSWANGDANTVGYYVLRSTDGIHFSVIATIGSKTTTSFTDSTVASGHNYDYEVEAYNGSIVSPASNSVAVTTPLVAPTGVVATAQMGEVKLTWTDKDANATGYYIERSTNNSTFTTIATLSGESTASYTDSTVASGTTYYYRVQAFSAVASSAPTASVKVATPADGVTITTEYGNELVVTASGSSDTVSLFQSGSTLTIDADGLSFNEADPAAGVFVYCRGGADSIDVASSVTADTTVVSVDGVQTQIVSQGSDVSIWCDSIDSVTGTGTVHKIASFAGGVSKAVGAALANPTDAGAVMTVNGPLWGTGPQASDVNQGEVGDCYFLSTLAAFAGLRPQQLEQTAVSMGDGTYVVEFYSNGSPVFVRVNDQFSVGPFNGYLYAHPGSDGDIWAAVLEKAFCYFRTGANTYNSINAGWMGEVYSDLDVTSMNFTPGAISNNALYSILSSDLANGDPVTLGTSGNAPNLVSDHAYTLVSVYQVNGTNYYVVRNPWGVSGDSLENAQGYATLTYSQLVANFAEGCAAT
jgi:fibronectin type 3 domain-containing protein